MTTSEGAARWSTLPLARPTIDHAAELVSAIAQTRFVFEGNQDVDQALDYLRAVLDAGPAPARARTAASARDLDRVITAAHAAADLAEQQIGRAERATEANMDLARPCQCQEGQIASLIAALGALADGKQGRA